jgi:hypothetical protein
VAITIYTRFPLGGHVRLSYLPSSIPPIIYVVLSPGNLKCATAKRGDFANYCARNELWRRCQQCCLGQRWRMDMELVEHSAHTKSLHACRRGSNTGKPQAANLCVPRHTQFCDFSLDSPSQSPPRVPCIMQDFLKYPLTVHGVSCIIQFMQSAQKIQLARLDIVCKLNVYWCLTPVNQRQTHLI